MKLSKPINVAALRGLFYAVAAAAVGVLVMATPADLEGFGPWAPLVLWGARIGEAWLFDRNQPRQLGRLGGKGDA